jgi:anti-sigma factor RsiW
MLAAYIDDELAPTEAASIGHHIEGCATCRERLASLESVGRLVRSVSYYPAPDRLRTKVASGPRP